MKGLILSGSAFVFLLCVSSVGLRIYRGDKEFKVLYAALVVSIGLYTVLHATLPHDLGFLPNAGVEPAPVVDFWNGLLVLLTVFHGFWVFLYVTGVGPSVGMMLQVRERGDSGMTSEEAQVRFGGGQPQNAIFQRRLTKLLKGRYIAEKEGGLVLLPRGAGIASLSILLRRILNIEEGG